MREALESRDNVADFQSQAPTDWRQGFTAKLETMWPSGPHSVQYLVRYNSIKSRLNFD